MRIEDDGANNFRVYITHPEMFPPVTVATSQDYGNLKKYLRYRRVFLPNGEWAIYNNPASGAYLNIPKSASATNDITMVSLG